MIDIRYQQRKKKLKRKEIESLRHEVEEMKVGLDLLGPVLIQLAKEAKTKKFLFRGPEGNAIGRLATEDIAIAEQGNEQES